MARLFEKRDGPFRAHIPGSKSISHKYQYQSCPKSVTAVLMPVSTRQLRRSAFFSGGGAPHRAKYVVTNRGGSQSAAQGFAYDKIGSVIFSKPIHSRKVFRALIK